MYFIICHYNNFYSSSIFKHIYIKKEIIDSIIIKINSISYPVVIIKLAVYVSIECSIWISFHTFLYNRKNTQQFLNYHCQIENFPVETTGRVQSHTSCNHILLFSGTYTPYVSCESTLHPFLQSPPRQASSTGKHLLSVEKFQRTGSIYSQPFHLPSLPSTLSITFRLANQFTLSFILDPSARH